MSGNQDSDESFTGEQIRDLIENEQVDDVQIVEEAVRLGVFYSKKYGDKFRDCVSDSIVAFLENPKSFQIGTIRKYLAWLMTCARRRWLDEHRKESKKRPLLDLNVPQDEFFERLLALDMANQIGKIISKLTLEQRIIFIRRQLLGHPFSEIAKSCGKKVDTVRQIFSRAKRQIQDDLDNFDKGAEE